MEIVENIFVFRTEISLQKVFCPIVHIQEQAS